MGDELCNQLLDDYFYNAEHYLFGLFGYAVITFIPYFIQITVLSRIENEIALNLRKDLYKKLLNLEVGYFDLPENESGGAATRFGNDSREACSLLTTYIPILVSNFSTVIGAVIICFIYDWRFGFVSILVTPLIALAFYIAMLFIGGYEDSYLQMMNQSDQIANELIVGLELSRNTTLKV
jgi:ATP-binding cassette subfamily B (MDR/TAP) protein 1